MSRIYINKTYRIATFAILIYISSATKADLLPDISLPDKGIIDFIETGPEWIPKPYKLPMDQGSLLSQQNLERVKPGLTREQVKFLLGSPSISDAFHRDRWDYVYYDRVDGEYSKPKRIVIIFKNEKVSELYDQFKLINKLGSEQLGENFVNAPIIENTPNEKNINYQEIVIARREDYLSLRKTDKLPVCIDEEYETYVAQKTLFNADEDTLEIRSDKQNQDEKGIFYASGNVEIERANDLVKSDNAEFNGETGILTAEDNVRYLTEDLSLYADKGGYNSQANTVSFSSVTYHFPSQDKPGKGQSENIFIDDTGIVHLTPASYTTCSLANPDWQITSSKTELHRDIDRGYAYNIFLEYKDVPILYSPFLSFPLSKKRHSGFLYPSIGSSGESGTVVSTPYYFNVAENLDITLVPTNFSGRGLMLESEFRYKTKNSTTNLEFANMHKDDVYGKSRHAFFVRDQRVYKNDLILKNNTWEGTIINSNINAGGVSDLTYFDDFGNTVSGVGRTHIVREGILNRTDYGKFGFLHTSLSLRSYQLTKKGGLQEQYKTIPKLSIEYSSNKKNNEFGYNFEGEIVNFDHTYATKATGTRITLYPSVEYPMINPGWEIIPKLGIKHTDYDLDAASRGSISRSTAILSVNGKMIFEKMVGENILQTLEPQMYLLYIPVGNQDDIPIFDTGENDFKYTLFSENKFYGEDRINDAKQITMALTSSIIDTSSGNELLRGTVGQIFYLDDRSVGLTSSTTNHSDASNMMGIINARFSDYWKLSGYTEFNPHAGYGEKNQIRLSYKRPYGRQNQIFNTSYRFSRGTQDEVDFSGVFPFNSRLSLVGKVNYSFKNRRAKTEVGAQRAHVLERMIGFEYESCCYGIKFVIRDYWNGTKKDNALYFEFLPKGIATSNNQTAELLREGILGYQDKFGY
jgi:LPS-assembly protein